MKKRTKRFDDGGMTSEDVGSFAGTPENESNAGMAEAANTAAAEARGEQILKGMRDQAAAAPKQRIVSKEELAKSGLSLRDFLNKERGLTRRGASPSASVQMKEVKAPAPPAAPAKAAYETPYDRMNRQNREASAAKDATAEETRRLANRVPARGRGVINTSNVDRNTLLPKRDSGYAKGGSVSSASRRGDGIAQRGKTRGKMV